MAHPLREHQGTNSHWQEWGQIHPYPDHYSKPNQKGTGNGISIPFKLSTPTWNRILKLSLTLFSEARSSFSAFDLIWIYFRIIKALPPNICLWKSHKDDYQEEPKRLKRQQSPTDGNFPTTSATHHCINNHPQPFSMNSLTKWSLSRNHFSNQRIIPHNNNISVLMS